MDCMRNSFEPGVLLDGRFRTVSALNHGSFGMVFKAFDALTKRPVAIKCLTKTSAADVCPSAIATDDKSEELAVHRRIGSHPNIVNLIHSFDTPNHVYLVLEYCSKGDLYEAIRLSRGPLQTEHVRDFMFQLISSVEHMHSKGVFHRDIKPENIFLAETGSMKLGDFGLATTDIWSYEASVGSDRYMAPEQFDPNGLGYAPALADIWSVGICLLNILFSRNPFAQPTASDPLYRDFVTDRQTLFDIFPTMSYDTFDVLIHCLAIDPANRSFAAAKEALKRVVSFTTDDESLDEFCGGTTGVAMATANREPLRTPSISTKVDAGGAFPWAKIARSPPQPIRQLPSIPDLDYSDGLFSSFGDDLANYSSSKPDSTSVVSFGDSGLGISVQSSTITPVVDTGELIKAQRTRPVTISGSLPATTSRSIHSMRALSKKRGYESKSWSDLWEEDDEAAHSECENTASIPFGAHMKRDKTKDWGYESSGGRSTPRNRAALTEVDASVMNNSRNRSPFSMHERFERDLDERISEHTGFIFEDVDETPTKKVPLKKRSMPDLDKWSKLGARRRGESQAPSPPHSGQTTPKPTAVKREADGKTPTPTPRKRSNTRVGEWRGRTREVRMTKETRGKEGKDASHSFTTSWFGALKDSLTGHRETGIDKDSIGVTCKEWSTSKDWRQHSPTHAPVTEETSSPAQPRPYSHHPHSYPGQKLPPSVALDPVEWV